MSLPCSDCITGTLNPGTPTGRVETLHGLPTYISDPQEGVDPKGIVVMIPDAFGWELVNSRVLADAYAKEGGFRVLLPEFMDGHWMAHDLLDTVDTITSTKVSIFSKILPVFRAVGLFIPFMTFNRASITGPRIYAYFRTLRTSTTLPIGVAGFCWGGRWTVLLCSGAEKTADGKPLVDCGFTAHPSMLDVPRDLEAVKLPLSVANGTKDIQVTEAQLPVVEGVFERKRKEGVQCELVVYEGAKHGFAVRGDPESEDEKRQGKEAEVQAVKWFGRYLTGENK